MAPTKPEQIAKMVRSLHENMKSRQDPNTVTLAAVAEQMFQVHGLELTEQEIADALNDTESDESRGGPGRSIFSRHAQGRSTTSGKAHSLSQKAAEASHEAKMEGSSVAHGHAAACHADAATAHRNAARFHDRASDYHQQRANGNDDAVEPDALD